MDIINYDILSFSKTLNKSSTEECRSKNKLMIMYEVLYSSDINRQYPGRKRKLAVRIVPMLISKDFEDYTMQ